MFQEIGGPIAGPGDGTGVKVRPGRKDMRRVRRIKIGTGTTTTGCKKGDIRRTVRRASASIRACYERQLMVGFTKGGRMTARWTIGLDGRVSAANVIGGTLRHGALEGCVMRAIRRLRFPRPENGLCVIQWPFLFRYNP